MDGGLLLDALPVRFLVFDAGLCSKWPLCLCWYRLSMVEDSAEEASVPVPVVEEAPVPVPIVEEAPAPVANFKAMVEAAEEGATIVLQAGTYIVSDLLLIEKVCACMCACMFI